MERGREGGQEPYYYVKVSNLFRACFAFAAAVFTVNCYVTHATPDLTKHDDLSTHSHIGGIFSFFNFFLSHTAHNRSYTVYHTKSSHVFDSWVARLRLLILNENSGLSLYVVRQLKSLLDLHGIH